MTVADGIRSRLVTAGRRRLGAVAYYGFASRLHPLLPGGRALRAALARGLCDGVGSRVNIAPGVRLAPGLRLHDDAGIGAGTVCTGPDRIELGERLIMGPQCLFVTNDHPVPPDGGRFWDQPARSAPIVVEADVFIGARVTVLPGVVIGRGAAVAAGAVVTRDVRPGAVVGGVPARELRHRLP